MLVKLIFKCGYSACCLYFIFISSGSSIQARMVEGKKEERVEIKICACS